MKNKKISMLLFQEVMETMSMEIFTHLSRLTLRLEL